MDPNTEICVTCGGTDVLDEAVHRLAKLTELLK